VFKIGRASVHFIALEWPVSGAHSAHSHTSMTLLTILWRRIDIAHA
jgi:hypothetical protein